MNKIPDSCKDCVEYGSHFCDDCLTEITEQLSADVKQEQSEVVSTMSSSTKLVLILAIIGWTSYLVLITKQLTSMLIQCINKLVNVEATWTHTVPRGSTALLHQDNTSRFNSYLRGKHPAWIESQCYFDGAELGSPGVKMKWSLPWWPTLFSQNY